VTTTLPPPTDKSEHLFDISPRFLAAGRSSQMSTERLDDERQFGQPVAMPERLFETATVPVPGPPHQRTLDDLGQPLRDVTFCVVDLETTGGSAADCAITEIGAVKLRGGECLGTYQTLVDPGQVIPPEITVLTGITQSMVTRAPRIESVLPSLLEFLGDAVVVGHNVGFDVRFLDAALQRDERPRITNRIVDTVPLARRLLRDEVPNCRLGTLADRLRLDHQPSHRALDDALATGDLLHVLIERAGALGVFGLDDLMALPTMAGHAQAAKLRLTENLPRQRGVYAFRDRHGTVLYVGKAANLRSRVRSYFSSDTRKKVAQLLRETARIDHRVCRNGLEAAVLELRMIHRHLPRFNRQGTRSGRYPYVKLTLHERFPRLSVVRSVRDDGALYLGPVSSTRRANQIIEAIESAIPIRRCRSRPPSALDRPVCAPAQLGVACCPCSGSTSEAEYRRVVERVVLGLGPRPDLLLAPLQQRIADLAGAERYEEAADVRDRAEALSGAIRRSRRFDLWRRAGRVRLHIADSWVEIDGGRLTDSGEIDAEPGLFSGLDLPTRSGQESLPLTTSPLPVPSRAEADELLCIAAWLDENAANVRLVACDGVVAEAFPPLPSFVPRKDTPSRSLTRHVGGTPPPVRVGRRARSPVHR
jgi:DNA polymerase-3 subunit epsilon